MKYPAVLTPLHANMDVFHCADMNLLTGEWNFRGLGFTAIAHPAPVRVADNHGVFILEDMLNPWESYRKGTYTHIRMYHSIVL